MKACVRGVSIYSLKQVFTETVPTILLKRYPQLVGCLTL